MALSNGTTYEIRTTGNDANSGGFDPSYTSGVDRSQQDSPHVIIDGTTISAVVSATTTNLTLTGYTPVSTDAGNLVAIRGGSATAGIYLITSVSGSDWVFDRAVGSAGQTATGRMGGALASLGQMGADVGGYGALRVECWIKSGTYLMAATKNVAGGYYMSGNFDDGTSIRGYSATRGDKGTATITPTGSWSSVSDYMITVAVSRNGFVENLIFDSSNIDSVNALSVKGPVLNSRFINPGANCYATKYCELHGCAVAGSWTRAGDSCIFCDCWVEGGAINSTHINCIIRPTIASNGGSFTRCVIDGGSYLILGSWGKITYKDCWLYNVPKWLGTNNYLAHISDCFRYPSGAYSDESSMTVKNNRYLINLTDVTDDPFIDAAGGDYRLTDAAIAAYRASATSRQTEDTSGEDIWTDVINKAGGGKSNSAGPLRGIVR